MAALVDLSRNKTRIERPKILDICQVAALNFVTFDGWLHMCICAYVVVRVWLMFVHMYVKRSCLRCMVVNVCVTSVKVFFVFSHLLSILHFAV